MDEPIGMAELPVEASKGVGISVISSAAPSSAAARRFDLLFVSNGRAHRILHRASRFAEKALYPDDRFPRKPVDRIAMQLASVDLTSMASVRPGAASGEYVVLLSLAVMSAADADAAVSAAVHRSVARLWLWDEGGAPGSLMEAMADYLAAEAGFRPSPNSTCGESGRCWCWSAEFVSYCEERELGFVARLNRGMRQGWTEFTADHALGSPVKQAYAEFRSPAGGNLEQSGNSTSDRGEERQRSL
ncbi:hypothetical protein ZIOFF_044569 [Zingiber officinale]|uniref:Uncharacterized protein n=1 Tax=Zingiber officinale TaxID=94328 RepID=A0A8J5G6E9_ZINOF|nr:hypothetical protein ZIOFF_044569 [Zingiber officinale]